MRRIKRSYGKARIQKSRPSTQKGTFYTAQAFIIDGQILSTSLKLLGKDTTWIRQVLQANNIANIKDVFFAQIDEQGNIYIDKRKDDHNIE
ncbi:YetF domain-containing protein [Halalkalibacter krulwichiae]|uniref:YetF domain-containing protein n=1 Tax=Halalkalibacter krulwichiae TaxID=199441 RepID=UPI00350E41F4